MEDVAIHSNIQYLNCATWTNDCVGLGLRMWRSQPTHAIFLFFVMEIL